MQKDEIEALGLPIKKVTVKGPAVEALANRKEGDNAPPFHTGRLKSFITKIRPYLMLGTEPKPVVSEHPIISPFLILDAIKTHGIQFYASNYMGHFLVTLEYKMNGVRWTVQGAAETFEGALEKAWKAAHETGVEK